MDAESFDTIYRSLLWANAQDNSGELRIYVPSNANRVPELPPVLPRNAPPAARARRDATVRMILKTEQAEAARKNKSKGGG
ncbi:unnamed protein product, partial [Choristocarpus tenellus]